MTSRREALKVIGGSGLVAGTFGVAGCTSMRGVECAVSEHRHPGGFGHGRPFRRLAHTGHAYFGPGDLYVFLVTGAESGGRYFQMEALVPPGGGPPPHVHRHEDETFYITRGELSVMLDGVTSTVGEGGFVNIPHGTLHGFKNTGSMPATMLVTFSPAGIERFFEEVFVPAPSADASVPPPPADESMVKRIIEVGSKYGMEFPKQ